MTTQTEMWLPEIGDIHESQDALIKELESKGWKLEGCDTAFEDNGEILGWNIGVVDRPSRTWVMIDLKPYGGKAEVTRIQYPVTSPKWNPARATG